MRRTAFVWAPAVICFLGLSALGWSLSFYADDFMVFSDADMRVDFAGYVQLPVFTHLLPALRLITAVFFDGVGFNWPMAALLLAALGAISAGCAGWLAFELTAHRGVASLVTVIVGLSQATYGGTRWWTGGLQNYPVTAFLLASLAAYARALRTRSVPWCVGSLAFACAAGASAETAAMGALLFVALRLALGPRSPIVGRRPRTRTDSWAWTVVLISPLLAGAAWYLVSTNVGLEPSAGLGPTSEAVWHAFYRSFLPSTWGFRTPLVTELPLIGVVVLCASLALAGVCIVKRPATWWLFAFAGVFFAIQAGVIASQRLSKFGEDILLDPRYFTLVQPVAIVVTAWAACLAFPQLNGGPGGTRSATVPLTCVAIGYLLIATPNFIDEREFLRDARAPVHGYLTNLTKDVAELPRPLYQWSLAPGAVPPAVVQPWLAPFNSLERVVPLVVPAITVGKAGAQEVRVSERGQLTLPGGRRIDTIRVAP